MKQLPNDQPEINSQHPQIVGRLERIEGSYDSLAKILDQMEAGIKDNPFFVASESSDSGYNDGSRSPSSGLQTLRPNRRSKKSGENKPLRRRAPKPR